MLKAKLMRILTVAVLTSIATFAFADDAAPVYDADSYPPAFDGQSDVRASAVPESPYVQDAPISQSLSSEQRISKMEQQINNLQRANAASRVESLQSDVQALRGQVEQLTHQLQQVQTQQRTMYTDLDKRVNKQASIKPSTDVSSDMNASASEIPALRAQTEQLTNQSQQKTSTTTAKAKSKSLGATKDDATIAKSASVQSDDRQPNVAEEQQIYQTAYDLIKAKKYNEAISALQKMLQKYPSGQFAANAHYWLGELYGLLGKNDQSAKEFSSIVKIYPNSPKVSDAQLKLGLIYMAQSKWVDAKSAFKKVINRFPGTASARLAAEQLKQVKEAGH